MSLINPREIKRRANAIRKEMVSEAYYDRKYKDLRVADLLILLEEDNYHTEAMVLEAIASLDYYYTLEACKIMVEQDSERSLTDELYMRRLTLMDNINKG